MSDAVHNSDDRADAPNALDARLHGALREGLAALPVPAASPNFDRRVLDALEQPSVPWWRAGWAAARPVLAAGACSLVCGLVLLRFAASVPTSDDAPVRPAAMAAASGPAVDADTLVEAAARRRAALRDVLSASIPRAAERPIAPQTAPGRRSQSRVAPLA